MESHSGPTAKVAIPRLKRPDHHAASFTKPPRARTESVNKACTRCRRRKTKCSGTRPKCINCEKQGEDCVYEQPRRDRLREAIDKSDLLIALVKEIRGSLSDEHAKKVDDVLQRLGHESPAESPSAPSKSMYRPSSSDVMDHDVQGLDDTLTSTSITDDDHDYLEEDLFDDQGSTGTGYLGRNSQVQWMRTLQRKLDHSKDESSDEPYAPPSHDSWEASAKRSEALHARQNEPGNSGPLSDYYFYLDNQEMIEIDQVDPHTIPPAETATRLFDFYQRAVHGPFRILDDQFEEQLGTYYQVTQAGGMMNVDPKWSAILNLVFAIGARYSHLVGADWQADKHDHLVYMSRAVHFLGLKSISSLICAPDRLLIQATGLLSFYYLIIGHVSRAWYMIGISIRFAQAAGLHLRNEDRTTSLDKKRATAQMWWALHSVECILTSITGRPRVIERKDCTVPLLSQFNEKQPGEVVESPHETSGFHSKGTTTGVSSARGNQHLTFEPSPGARNVDAFMDSWTQLDLLQHKTLSSLYAARTSVHSWKYMQDQITELTTELDAWASQSLPQGSLDAESLMEFSMGKEQLLLYFYYQSVRICVTRPCLCRLDGRMKSQTEESAKFNQTTGTACVQAALDLTSWLPEPDSARWLYEKGPWWSSVHIIMQAITILLMELAQGPSRANASDVARSVVKLTRWLKAMTLVDAVAERAYDIVCRVLTKNKDKIEKYTPGQWPHDMLQGQENEPRVAFDNTSLGLPRFNEDVWNSTFSSSGNEPSFGSNRFNTSQPESCANEYQFAQEPYPYFYSNHFTLFDEPMDYTWANVTEQGDWSTTGEQYRPQ